MKSPEWLGEQFLLGLSPRGASVLKLILAASVWAYPESRPARGEWIEILHIIAVAQAGAGLAPRGASGLK